MIKDVIPVFVAINKYGKRISLLDPFVLKDLQRMKSLERFYCQSCGEEVVMKLGQSVAWHFAHKKTRGGCPNHHEPETVIHQSGKHQLYHWLSMNGVEADVEFYLPEIQRRPDIYIKGRQPPLAVEFQCATIGYEQLKARSDDLASQGIHVSWIFGGQRLKKLAPNLFKLPAMELAVLQEVSMQERTHRSRSYLLRYFTPSMNGFSFLQLFFPLTSTQWLGVEHFLPTASLNLQEFLTPSFKSSVPLSWKKHWIRQKKHWRMKALPKFSPLERHLFIICSKQMLNFNCFPSYIGLPVVSSASISTPSYLWQMWVIIHFLSRGKDAYFTLGEIERGFQKMLKQRYFHLHPMLVSQSVQSALREYLFLLSRIGMITLLPGSRYRIEHSPEWENADLQALLLRDRSMLDQLF